MTQLATNESEEAPSGGRKSWRHADVVTLGVAIVSLLGFSLLAYLVAQQTTLAFDAAVLRSINSTSSAWQDTMWQVITDCGGAIAVTFVTILASVALVYRRSIRGALQFAMSVGGAMALSASLKLIFMRERPELWQQLIAESTYSFPSGHAIGSSAIALGVIVLLWHTKWRLWAVLGGLLYIGLIGYSRMYLGVHYPTDIMAGWLISAAWVGLMVIAFRRRRVY